MTCRVDSLRRVYTTACHATRCSRRGLYRAYYFPVPGISLGYHPPRFLLVCGTFCWPNFLYPHFNHCPTTVLNLAAPPPHLPITHCPKRFVDRFLPPRYASLDAYGCYTSYLVLVYHRAAALICCSHLPRVQALYYNTRDIHPWTTRFIFHTCLVLHCDCSPFCRFTYLRTERYGSGPALRYRTRSALDDLRTRLPPRQYNHAFPFC